MNSLPPGIGGGGLVAKSCPALCDPIECSLPGSSAHEISQARILEWAAMPLSSESSRSRNQIHVSRTAGGFFTTEPPGVPGQ